MTAPYAADNLRSMLRDKVIEKSSDEKMNQYYEMRQQDNNLANDFINEDYHSYQSSQNQDDEWLY